MPGRRKPIGRMNEITANWYSRLTERREARRIDQLDADIHYLGWRAWMDGDDEMSKLYGRMREDLRTIRELDPPEERGVPSRSVPSRQSPGPRHPGQRSGP